jgi:hypothetical protein
VGPFFFNKTNIKNYYIKYKKMKKVIYLDKEKYEKALKSAINRRKDPFLYGENWFECKNKYIYKK